MFAVVVVDDDDDSSGGGREELCLSVSTVISGEVRWGEGGGERWKEAKEKSRCCGLYFLIMVVMVERGEYR